VNEVKEPGPDASISPFSPLFNPWRMSYLISGATGAPDGRCLFCWLPEGADEEALIVHRGRTVFAVLNRYPYTNGHVMVAPFAHRGTLSDLSSGERAELLDVAALLEQALGDTYRPQGLNAGVNIGKSAGAGVPGHLHLHLVPRWDGDTSFMTVVSGTRTVPEDLATTRGKLASWLARRPGHAAGAGDPPASGA
jgi:ATP adenylyltransferase